MDQQFVGDGLAGRLADVDGVEVFEECAETGGDVLPPVGLYRTAGQQGAQPRRLGQRRRKALRVAPGDVRGDLGGYGVVFYGGSSQLARRQASVSRWVMRCATSSRASAAAPSISVDLRRRRNGRPIR
jgi:hypothetical protein